MFVVTSLGQGIPEDTLFLSYPREFKMFLEEVKKRDILINSHEKNSRRTLQCAYNEFIENKEFAI